MVRIAGVDLSDKKRVHIGLTYLYGVGRNNVWKLLKEVDISPDKRIGDLTQTEINKIQKIIEEEFKVESKLQTEVVENIKRLKEIGSYRGIRHIRNLPVRGQRTRSNARTKRGKRRTVGTLRKGVRMKMEKSQKSTEKTAV